MAAPFVVWGSELSPFALKLRAVLSAAGLPFRFLPDEGSRLENLRLAIAIERGKRARTIHRHPARDPLDEYPLVPFLREPGGRLQYDSSAIARWVDARHPPTAGPLFPDTAALGFVAQLIDEAFDEFGLYMVHHNRWVLSAATNDAGRRLAHEMRWMVLPPFRPFFARYFSRRQVRRLPYLFSVAPPGARHEVEPSLQPPARAGFPPTHAFLDTAWEETLAALESLLAARLFVLGARFTVADASIYGQLGMNLADHSANERMRALAPRTHAWIVGIHEGRHAGSAGALGLGPELAPLLALIGRTFVPLMQQNAAAHDAAVARGATAFNEPAFDRGAGLYDGMLGVQPFRSVVKTFQVRVWCELCTAWRELPEAARAEVRAVMPVAAAFDG